MHSRLLVTVALAALGALAGCAHSQSPVLYPNAKLQQAGKEQADRDVEACRKMADDYVSNPMAKDAAKGGAVGGVGGARRPLEDARHHDGRDHALVRLEHAHAQPRRVGGAAAEAAVERVGGAGRVALLDEPGEEFAKRVGKLGVHRAGVYHSIR